MDSKVCVICNMEKAFVIFITNIEYVNLVIVKKVQNVTMKTKIKYQINKNYIMKKTEMCYLQSLKKSQQNRKYEIKTDKKQIKDLNKKLEGLTQAIEKLKIFNS